MESSSSERDRELLKYSRGVAPRPEWGERYVEGRGSDILAGMSMRPGKSEAEVEVEARDVAYLVESFLGVP